MNNRAFVAIKMSRRQGARRAYPAEASPAQEYRLRLKQPAPTLSPRLGGPLYLNPQPVSFLAALALPGLLPRVAPLTLRFRLEKYAQHTSTETGRRKNSGSSQSLASLLRLTELTNQSTNMSTALNNNSTRSRVPGTVAISDDEMRRFAPSVFASQPIEGVSAPCKSCLKTCLVLCDFGP